MVRVLTASTAHINDLEAAIQDITSQLDCDHRLLKNSVGIMACHYEFALSGTVAAISRALPFDTLGGAITSAQGTPGKAGVLLLSVMVLTSDDARFVTALTPPLKQNVPKVIEETYMQN